MTNNKTICLNMIVRDNKDVIERCINSVKGIIDYWVICDTGSVDDTPKIIRKLLKGIPGKLLHHQWENFEVNRTKAIQAAKGTADYILIMDSDEEAVVDDKFDKSKLAADFYRIRSASAVLDYTRERLLKGDLDWTWKGYAHEYVHSTGAKTAGELQGLKFVIFPSEDWLGHIKRNADLLEKEVKDRPGEGRPVFYLAQSYKDMGLWQQAIPLYLKRIEIGGWDEETWYCHYMVTMCYARLNNDDQVLLWGSKAYQLRPFRIEPLAVAGQYFREKGKYAVAMMFLEPAVMRAVRYPATDNLFIEPAVYKWAADFEYSIVCYYMFKFKTSLEYSDKVIVEPSTPESVKKQAMSNKVFSEAKLQRPVTHSDRQVVYGRRAEVDMVIISDAKNNDLMQTTYRCLDSLVHSEGRHITFNIFVVESQKDVNWEIEGINIKTVHPETPFNYNAYCNLARKQGKAEYVCLCNNDLVFHKGWASALLLAMENESLDSASPYNPYLEWHSVNFGLNRDNGVKYGWRIGGEVTGWCLFHKRSIYEAIGDLGDHVEFWYSDNQYILQLQEHGLKHGLVTNSFVDHICNKTLDTLDKDTQEKITLKQRERFEDRHLPSVDKKSSITFRMTDSRPMVFDFFPYFNELDLLLLRLNELWDVVDYFVVSDATMTHSGKPRNVRDTISYQINDNRFKPYLSKIKMVTIDNLPKDCDDPWIRERLQRDMAIRLTTQLRDDDIIISSDIDEIPKAEAVLRYVQENMTGVTTLEMSMYYYYMNNQMNNKWLHPKIMRYKDIQGRTLSDIRLDGSTQLLADAGWHFSYLGGPDAIRSKLEAFAHQEYNTDEIKLAIEENMKDTSKDIFGRQYSFDRVYPTRFSHPSYIFDNWERYSRYMMLEEVTNALIDG